MTDPIKPPDLTLKEFGYIAGGYQWGKCRDCKNTLEMVAKYSTRCFDCATKAKAAKESQPARIHDGLDPQIMAGDAMCDHEIEHIEDGAALICDKCHQVLDLFSIEQVNTMQAEIRRLRATPAPCPHISSSDEGTNSCDLAGVTGEELQNLREECQRLREAAKPLTWLRVKPTEPGFYWMRITEGCLPWISQVHPTPAGLQIDRQQLVRNANSSYEWAGPIPPPQPGETK